jgi:phage replication-related protein YjqB (UPF0714/DUF867 family)
MKYPFDRSSIFDEGDAPDENDTPDQITTPEEKSTLVVGRRELFRLMGTAALPLIAPGCLSEEEDDWSELPKLRASEDDDRYQVEVHMSKQTQSILNHREELSINYELADYLGLTEGDQCRIVRNGHQYAIYTVAEIRDEPDISWIRMSRVARERLGTSGTFDAKILTAVVAEGLTDSQAEKQSELVERLVHDGCHNGLVVLAPHGGNVEPGTDEEAEDLHALLSAAGKEVSSWVCKGFKKGGGAYLRWHITSTALSPNSFPGLGELYNCSCKFEYAVSFHGISEANRVIVGGGDDTGGPNGLKEKVRDALAAVLESKGIEVVISSPTGAHAGYSEENVVNWLTSSGKNGIQISQSRDVRDDHRLLVVEAVASVFEPLL